jgi:hypothetical protein
MYIYRNIYVHYIDARPTWFIFFPHPTSETTVLHYTKNYYTKVMYFQETYNNFSMYGPM